MPNGYGNATLYSLSVSYSENDLLAFTKQIQIGFRNVILVEDDLQSGGEIVFSTCSIVFSWPNNYISHTSGRTFYIQVNDVPIFLKGSNWIPADILPELVTTDYIRQLLTSCVKANMNSLRVWGGGIYELDEFYQVRVIYIQFILFEWHWLLVLIDSR